MNSKAKVSVLLIANEKSIAKSIEHQLVQSSIRCILHCTETLYEGIDFIQNTSVNLVLLDLNLPDTKGFRTLTSYLEKAQNTPVIVLADTNNEIVGNQSIKAGAQDFLVKGKFDARTLGRSIWYSIQRFSAHSKLQSQVNQLSINAKRYEYGQEMAHVGNWELDIVSNEMNWTEEVYRIFGFQPNSFSPSLSEYINYVHIEDRAKVEDFFEYASKDGKVHHLEHRIIIDGHNLKHIAVRCKISFEETSGKLMLLGVIQDITQSAVNKQLVLKQNYDDRISKIMQRALSDMSFNIRTPLSSIVNFVYLLKNTTLSNQQTELLNALKVSVDDMSLVLNNLFNFAVLATKELVLEKQEFKIKDFFKSNEKIGYSLSNNHKVKFQFDTDTAMPEKINVDPKKLTLVFYNFINFLTKDQNPNSTIYISSKVKSLMSNSAKLTIQFQKENFILSSSDINILLDSEKLLQVYDSNNESNDESNDNNTLNIAVILKLVNLLSGQVKIENETANNKTTFSVEVPVQVVSQPSFSESDKPNSPLRILLVEDHFLNQIATKKVLKSWSEWVSVDIAENGLIAVGKQREHEYDVIIMDIQMPVMDGIEASKKIREKSSIPIIALTANSSKQEQDRCASIGINSYLSKPFKPTELYEKIMLSMESILVAKGG